MRLIEYLRAQGREALLNEWDAERNGTLDPAALAPYSKLRVWWICQKGHRWRAMLSARAVHETGCPYCAGLRPIPGETDLATTAPETARLWHPTKNAPLTPDQFMAGSHKKVWWQCDHGHEWQAMIYSIAGGTGCPWCSGKLPIPGKTDLATTHPQLAAEWDTEKNLPLKVTEVSQGTERSVWWRCPEGHSFEARVFSRVAGTGCPYCTGKRVLAGFNDLATTHPQLVEQWYQPLNGSLTPQMVNRGSHKKVWWRCSEGHVWQAAVYARSREKSSDCPVCFGRTRRRTGDAASLQPTAPRAAPPAIAVKG